MDTLSTEQFSAPDFEERIAKIRPRLRGYLLGLTASLSAAEDLTQETTVILWKKQDEFDPSTNFKAWAFQIGFFQAQNHRRKEARRIGLELPLDSTFERLASVTLPPADDRDVTRKEALAFCLAKLPDEHRELILRRYQDGLSLEKLSSEENSNRNALAQKLFRLKRNLLSCIEKKSPKL